MSEEKERFEFDLNKITYGEIQQLGLMESIEQDEYSIKLVVQTLVSWPFGNDITNDSIRGLGMLDFIELQEAFTAVLDNAFKSLRGTE